MADPGHELVDIVDEQGRIIGVAPRREMRSRGLPHRATFVIQLMVDPAVPDGFTPDSQDYASQVESWFSKVSWAHGARYDGPGPLLHDMVTLTEATLVVVHQRADWKDVNPGYWDLAFGGVCGAGEPWLPSARRELEEEAGLVGLPIVPIGAERYVDNHSMEFAGLFAAPTTTEPVPNDGEVVAVDYVPVADLSHWCRGRQVCGDSLALVLPLLDHLVS